jgi:hypothetical protein
VVQFNLRFYLFFLKTAFKSQLFVSSVNCLRPSVEPLALVHTVQNINFLSPGKNIPINYNHFPKASFVANLRTAVQHLLLLKFRVTYVRCLSVVEVVIIMWAILLTKCSV